MSDTSRFELGNYFPTRKRARLSPIGQRKADEFHSMYYEVLHSVAPEPSESSWLGYRTLKLPFDLMTYQEIICEKLPDVIIEAGTKFGGSALFFSSICEMIGNGRVVTIDIKMPANPPRHPLLTYLTGSSTAGHVVEDVKSLIKPAAKVMVILDSDHRKPHVDEELSIYADMVTQGQYLIVEDGNINGHPVFPGFGPGPQEAIQEFVSRDRRFEVDKNRERHLMSFAPNGFLLKL